ncbi:Jasmonoyl--L-amino acid synthetase JAR6-like protein [Drosera capensis]
MFNLPRLLLSRSSDRVREPIPSHLLWCPTPSHNLFRQRRGGNAAAGLRRSVESQLLTKAGDQLLISTMKMRKRCRGGVLSSAADDALSNHCQFHLPLELLNEILARLPLKVILRFRCVCKTCCLIVEDPEFAVTHLKISSTIHSQQYSRSDPPLEYPIQRGKALMFIYSSKQFRTSGGLNAGTATTNIFRHPQFRHRMKGMQSQCCSPDDVIFGADFHQSLYCHLLCGLLHPEEIQFVPSTFAHSIVHAFEAFEQDWEQFCADI